MFLPWFWLQLWAAEAAGTSGGEPGTTSTFGERMLESLEGWFHSAIGTLLFGLIGILLALVGLKAFDWITPRIDIQRELAERHNIAVAVVVAAVLLGVCYIIAQVAK
jgi:putative membrane protein